MMSEMVRELEGKVQDLEDEVEAVKQQRDELLLDGQYDWQGKCAELQAQLTACQHQRDELAYWKQRHTQDVNTLKEELREAEKAQGFCFACGCELSEQAEKVEPVAYCYEKKGEIPVFTFRRWDTQGRETWIESKLYTKEQL
jgi:chromosome segregation ATPase